MIFTRLRSIRIGWLRVLALPFFYLMAIDAAAQADLTLRFASPATHFTESLPLGNGRLGAMIFGNPNRERIVLNEISLWSGGIEDPNRQDAHLYLDSIRQLLLTGNNPAAQQLLQQYFVCAGKGSGQGSGAHVKYGCYQTLGDCEVVWNDTSSAVSDYERELQLDQATARVCWKRRGVLYTQQTMVSAPAQKIIIQYSSSRKGGLHFSTRLSRRERAQYRSAGNILLMSGQLDGGDGAPGIRYAAGMQIKTVGGRVRYTDSTATVIGSDTCWLIIDAATDMNWPNVAQRGPDPQVKVRQSLERFRSLPMGPLWTAHIRDYQLLFNSCRLRLQDPFASLHQQQLLQDRLTAFQQGHADPSLVALYFNFGRYLLISSSRPGNLPANLQGLWAEEYQTPWNSDYHININLQMNYWLANATNLPTVQQPLFRLIRQMAERGSATAQAYYRARGWVAHVIFNPWGFTAPGEGADWGSTLTGGAWLATHLLDYYDYYGDDQFLREQYPILKGAAQFFTDILIREPSSGWLVTAPSNSPENAFRMADGRTANTCMGPTIDMQIGRQLLLGTATMADRLDIDRAWADSVREIARQLAPNRVSERTGALMEWLQDYEEVEPHHRHVSHLYGLHPYDEINPWDTPELAAAARKTLERRGDGGTGWSRAWKIAFWARLGDGDHATLMLRQLLEPVKASSGIQMNQGAGTYPNLFDAHPPFQIDGNLGAVAAIAEMIVQSHGRDQVIRLLPAIPSDALMASGEMTGIRARGGFVLDLKWENRQLTALRIKSELGKPCQVAVQQLKEIRENGRPITWTTEAGIHRFVTRAGQSYEVILQ